MDVAQKSELQNWCLRYRIEELSDLVEIERICEKCVHPFDYGDGDNLQLSWLLDELELRCSKILC